MVRAAWPSFDKLVSKDLAKVLALSEGDAKDRVDDLWRARACLAELGQVAPAAVPAAPEVPLLPEVLVTYRAGYVREALQAARGLDARPEKVTGGDEAPGGASVWRVVGGRR